MVLSRFPAGAVHCETLISCHSPHRLPNNDQTLDWRHVNPGGDVTFPKDIHELFWIYNLHRGKTTTGNRPFQGETRVLFYLCPALPSSTPQPSSFFVSSPRGARLLCPRKLTCPGQGELQIGSIVVTQTELAKHTLSPTTHFGFWAWQRSTNFENSQLFILLVRNTQSKSLFELLSSVVQQGT